MTTCVIMRIEDFTLYKVTTSGKRQFLKEFICGKLKYKLFVVNKLILLILFYLIAQNKRRDKKYTSGIKQL